MATHAAPARRTQLDSDEDAEAKRLSEAAERIIPTVRVPPTPPDFIVGHDLGGHGGWRFSSTGRIPSKAARKIAEKMSSRERTAPALEQPEPAESTISREELPAHRGVFFYVAIVSAVLGFAVLGASGWARWPVSPAAAEEFDVQISPSDPAKKPAGLEIPANSPLSFSFKPRVPSGSEIVAEWVAEDIGDPARANSIVRSATMKVADPAAGVSFAFTPAEGGWQAGKYRLEIKHQTDLLRADRFVVP